MADHYHRDLSKLTLQQYKKMLQNMRLIPSQQILLENMNERFACLNGQGIKTVEDLGRTLKTKPGLAACARQTGIPEKYLMQLRREVQGFYFKPVELTLFAGVRPETVRKLAAMNIKNTLQLFDRVTTKKARQELAAKIKVPYREIYELTKQMDVVRIRYVRPVFARLLLESKVDTPGKIARADGSALFKNLKQINEEKKYYSGHLGEKDIQLLSDIARWVPENIEYES